MQRHLAATRAMVTPAGISTTSWRFLNNRLLLIARLVLLTSLLVSTVHAQHRRPRRLRGSAGLPAAPPVVVVTALLSKPCKGNTGNYVNLLSLRNKEDYAQLHGYGVYWSTETLDPALSGAWNKVAVLQALLQAPQYVHTEWFVWVDYDTLFANVSTAIPFDKYEGKDIVVWGEEHKMLQQHDATGTNTGVLLVRNSARSAALMADLAALGRDWDQGNSTTAQAMKAQLQHFSWALYDQAGLVYLLKTRPEYAAALYLESLEGSYGLHSHFVANLPLTMIGTWGLPLVVHYAGCQFCTEGAREGVYGLHYCLKHFFSINNMARESTRAMQGMGFQPIKVQDSIFALEVVDPELDAEFKQRL